MHGKSIVAGLSKPCAAVLPMPVVADSTAAMRAALRTAAERADLVLTTAGISVGDEDHVRDALRDLGGDLTVLKVPMKPRNLLAAGRLGDAAFVGLPGNPQAALAGAVGFARPLLARMSGTSVPSSLRACADFDLRRNPGRAEFIPVRLTQQGHRGHDGADGSGRLAPLLLATGFAYISANQEQVRTGQPVDVIPFGICGLAAASAGPPDAGRLTWRM